MAYHIRYIPLVHSHESHDLVPCQLLGIMALFFSLCPHKTSQRVGRLLDSVLSFYPVLVNAGTLDKHTSMGR